MTVEVIIPVLLVVHGTSVENAEAIAQKFLYEHGRHGDADPVYLTEGIIDSSAA